ncbi:MAG: RNA 2',3'-cyclic phosphodiesterase [Planctomycetota bacterium]
MRTLRTFIAIPIAQKIASRLEKAQQSCREMARLRVSWVPPESMHVTLKFLGEIAFELLPDVTLVVQEATRGMPPLHIQVARLGTFPESGDPKVIWAGVTDEPGGSLSRIAERLDRSLVPLGIRRERRPFEAHLTIGRVRQFDDPAGFERFIRRRKQNEYGQQRIEEVHVMSSELSPKGSMYDVVARVKL